MQPGGRGLFLIHELVDGLDFSMDGGLEVRMKKELPAEACPPVAGPASATRRPAAGHDRRPELVGVAALAAIAVLIAVFHRLMLDAAYAPPTLLAVLNLVFLGAAPVFVAVVAARSYLAERSRVLLLLGCGNLALAAGAVGSGLHLGGPDANAFVTVYATAAAGAAACGLASAVLSAVRTAKNSPGGRWTLWAAYGTVGVVAGAVVVLVRAGLWPVYFVTGSGHSTLSKTVLWSATAMFAVAAVLLAADLGRGRSAFRRWYALGLALISIGLAAVSLQLRLGDPLNWIGRSAQYAGAMTMAVAVVVAARRSGVWRVSLGRSLRERADRYRSLVEVSPDAILVHAGGVYVFANPAAAELFGAGSPDELVGRAVLDLVPDEDRALLALRVEQSYQEDAALHMRLRILRVDGRPVDVEVRGARVKFEGRPAAQIVVRDVTERRQAEAERERLLLLQDRLYEELAEKERLSSALNGIAAAITKLVDPQEILTRVVAQVAEAVAAESGAISLIEQDSWIPSARLGCP